MLHAPDHLNESILPHTRQNFFIFQAENTVTDVLNKMRSEDVEEQIFYFYVVDSENRLEGVVPTRRLLSSPPEMQLRNIMLRRVIALPENATLGDACELFIMHRLLAYPVVNENRNIVGMVDVSVFTDEVFDLTEKREIENIFQWIGVRVSELQNAGPLQAFRFRFPWLTATIAGGLAGAVLVSMFETTLTHTIVLVSFLAVVLGIGESVSVQAMTVTLQRLHTGSVGPKDILTLARQELTTAGMIGSACAAIVGGIAWLWRGQAIVAAALGVSIVLSVFAAGLIGLSIPIALHAAKKDPKIAAGPITLAMADVMTLFIYLSAAYFLRGRG